MQLLTLSSYPSASNLAVQAHARSTRRLQPEWTRRPTSAELPTTADLARRAAPPAGRPPLFRGRPLSAFLQSPLQAKLEASEAKTRDLVIAQFKSNKFDDLPRGDSLGRGSAKQAYELLGTDKALVVLENKKYGSIGNEIIQLQRLGAVGMPVAKIYKAGTFFGQQAMVMKRYEGVYKPYVPHLPMADDLLESPHINHNTLADLKKIRDTIQREGIVVDDLQYGIDRSGHLAVLDPLNVVRSKPGSDNHAQLRQLDSLMNALSAKLGAPPIRSVLKARQAPHA
jgi:hypothetical protein